MSGFAGAGLDSDVGLTLTMVGRSSPGIEMSLNLEPGLIDRRSGFLSL